MIRPRSHIAEMAAYALADMTVAKGKTLISLAQNESAFPPSPVALEAAQRALAEAALYPDPDWTDLRRAICKAHGLDPAALVCGNGSMELIVALIMIYSGPGDEVLSTKHAYALFRTATRAAGANYIAAPETNLTVDVDAVLAAVSPATRIVCIANPGNPTGTHIPRGALVRLREGLREDVLLVIDEAYGEFPDNPEPLFDLSQRGDTVVLRTFSKAYGLAGMRIGWGVFPPAIGAQIRKLINPNNISMASQAAATAAMRDREYMQQTVARTRELRAGFTKALRALGIDVPDSQTNFVLLQFNNPEDAASADKALRANGILMRGMAGYGLAHCLRATIGQKAHLDLAVETLRRWKEAKS